MDAFPSNKGSGGARRACHRGAGFGAARGTRTMRLHQMLVAVTGLLLACARGSTVSPLPHYDRATLEMKYQAVYALVQDLSCTDSSVCASIGIGSKPCGGPWRYLVYSTATVDVQELIAKVADLYAYESGYNAQEHIISDCSIARSAQPSCVGQKCIDLNSIP